MKPVQLNNPQVVALLTEMNIWLQDFYPENTEGFSMKEIHDLNAEFVAAYEGDFIVGVGGVIMNPDYAEVVKVYVHQDHRRKGVSRALMDYFENMVKNKGINTIKLFTGIRQPAVIEMYKKFGYEEIPPFDNCRNYPEDVIRSLVFFQKLI